MKRSVNTCLPARWICAATLIALPLGLAAATLTNRYSFTDDARDSISHQDGVLVGGATVSDGVVHLDGSSGYIDLPNNLVSNRTSITIEAWLRPESNPDWVRIWDFGNSSAGEDQPAAGITHFMCALKPSLRATIYAGGSDSWVFSAPAVILPEGTNAHVVWTSDAVTHRAHLYLNGRSAGVNPTAMNTPASMGSTLNNWLGRSQFSADAFLWADIDEFRVWDGALNPLQVAASYLAGPNSVTTNASPVRQIALQINREMVRGNFQQAGVLATIDNFPAQLDIADLDGVAYRSSAPEVLGVDPFGKITALSAGTATLTVEYDGQSDSASISVTEQPVVLTHRYSFTSDANDSAGNANGTLNGGAAIQSGKVVLDPSAESYVELPAGVLGDARALTIESWADFGAVGTWSRLWHLGDQNDAGLGRYYVELCPRGSAEDTFIGVSDSDPGGAHADSVARAGALQNQTNVHTVAVFNPLGGYIAYYINGALVGRNLGPSVLDLTKVQDIHNYLGRSLYSADPYLDGSIDEFRIYNGALSPVQVAVSYTSGPNQPRQDPGELQSIRLEPSRALALGGTAVPAVFANYSDLTNFNLTANAISGVPGLTLTSSDTNVAAVRPNATLYAAAPGTALLTAVYQGKTSAVPVTVTRPVATLKHRYSFTADAKDSVGTAHGTLEGAAKVQAGKLVLDGSNGTFVNLPGGLVSGLSAVTIEFWAELRSEPTWCRVFDFGNIINNNGAEFLFFTPRTHLETHRFTIGTASGTVDLDAPGGWQDRSVYLACVYDPAAGFMGVYTNGVQDIVNTNARVPLSAVGNQSSFIGRSLFAADGYLNATVDEVRIYEGRLYPDEIKAHFQLGPDTLTGEQVQLAIRQDGATFRLSWPATASGYVLETAPTLGPGVTWSPVTATPSSVGGQMEIQIPARPNVAFYRLRK